MLKFLILAVILLSCKSNDDIVDMDKLFEMTNVRYEGQMYAGYLQLDAETEFYYYLFTSTAPDPQNAPLFLWFNGGPGCSSLQGALNEHGPFVFPKGSTTFVQNPYAWTTLANVIYLESPAGVGFSKGKIPTNDDTAADQNLLAVKAFFKKYPEYANNDFYLSGESYAGVYIPLLANLLIGQASFKGFIIGNACTDITECSKLYENYPIHRIDYAGRNNLISNAVYREFQQQQFSHECDNPQKIECMLFTQAALADVFKVAFNPYNIYDKCYREQVTHDPNARFYKADDIVDCTDSKGMREFLINRQDYLKLTHVAENAPQWVECSKEYDTQYKILDKQSYYLYEKLIKSGLRIWIFSGDIDAVVPITGTLFWLNKLQNDYCKYIHYVALPIIEKWRPWFIPAARPEDKQQNAGNVLIIEGLTFVSVRGAGHMVPSDQAQAAHVMLNAFLKNERLPK